MKNKNTHCGRALFWNLSWTIDLLWLRAWGVDCRGHSKPASLGRVVQLQAATQRVSVKGFIFWSWPGWWWVFPPTWSQEYFSLITSPYKIYSQMYFQFFIYLKKNEWMKDQPLQESSCWLACFVLNPIGNSWMRLCPSWECKKRSFTITFNLPSCLLFKQKGEGWAAFWETNDSMSNTFLCLSPVITCNFPWAERLPSVPPTASQCEALF